MRHCRPMCFCLLLFALFAPARVAAQENLRSELFGEVDRTLDRVKEKEGLRLSEKVPERAQTVACESGGKALNSAEFADFLRKARDEDRDLAFLIGGAFGLASDVSSSSTMRLSLAPWTLPHEIARLVLAEQIYRAGTIVRGEPYHK